MDKCVRPRMKLSCTETFLHCLLTIKVIRFLKMNLVGGLGQGSPENLKYMEKNFKQAAKITFLLSQPQKCIHFFPEQPAPRLSRWRFSPLARASGEPWPRQVKHLFDCQCEFDKDKLRGSIILWLSHSLSPFLSFSLQLHLFLSDGLQSRKNGWFQSQGKNKRSLQSRRKNYAACRMCDPYNRPSINCHSEFQKAYISSTSPLSKPCAPTKVEHKMTAIQSCS